MAAPGTGCGTETLGREMREETYREGVGEIKVSLSWPNTVKLSGDQPLQPTTAEDKTRPPKRDDSSSPRRGANTPQGLEGTDRADRERSVSLVRMKSSDKGGSSLSI